MNTLLNKMKASPWLARAVPFVVFVAFTFLQGKLGSASAYWVYALKTVAGAWLVWLVWPVVTEMRWKFSWEAVVVGVAVFAVWVGLDDLYPRIGRSETNWNPNVEFGEDSLLAWVFIVVRTAGSTLVVPPLEEVFYRSFLYRYIVRPDFQSVPVGQFAWMPFIITSVVFGFAHHEWLAGILCGLAYQGLVCRKKRLGDAMTAHAITNLLLAFWVVGKEAWKYW